MAVQYMLYTHPRHCRSLHALRAVCVDIVVHRWYTGGTSGIRRLSLRTFINMQASYHTNPRYLLPDRTEVDRACVQLV